VRRSLHLLLPARPDQRRTRLLTTLTLVAGAATIAAVSATSTSDTASDTATLDRAAGADGTDTEVPDVSAAETRDSLMVLDGDRTHGDLDPVGPIERIATVEPLPSLRTEAERTESLVYVAADGTEVTPERIHAFLDGRGAPLAEQAELFVEAGLRHDVDPRVVVAIAIAESNGGEMHPQGSHNVWGWSGSGGPRGLRGWDSWEASIDEYTERLGSLYDTDDVDWDFASTYCPPNTQWWYDTVTWAIAQI
jgi:hypothetical protein